MERTTLVKVEQDAPSTRTQNGVLYFTRSFVPSTACPPSSLSARPPHRATAHGYSTPNALEGYFESRLQPLVSAVQRTMVVWEEAWLEKAVSLASSVVVEAWRRSVDVCVVTAELCECILESYVNSGLFPARSRVLLPCCCEVGWRVYGWGEGGGGRRGGGSANMVRSGRPSHRKGNAHAAPSDSIKSGTLKPDQPKGCTKQSLRSEAATLAILDPPGRSLYHLFTQIHDNHRHTTHLVSSRTDCPSPPSLPHLNACSARVSALRTSASTSYKCTCHLHGHQFLSRLTVPSRPLPFHVPSASIDVLHQIVASGHRGILAAPWYLDKTVPVAGSTHYGFIDTWRDFYHADPEVGLAPPLLPWACEARSAVGEKPHIFVGLNRLAPVGSFIRSGFCVLDVHLFSQCYSDDFFLEVFASQSNIMKIHPSLPR